MKEGERGRLVARMRETRSWYKILVWKLKEAKNSVDYG
jgi:hypothetical protein